MSRGPGWALVAVLLVGITTAATGGAPPIDPNLVREEVCLSGGACGDPAPDASRLNSTVPTDTATPDFLLAHPNVIARIPKERMVAISEILPQHAVYLRIGSNWCEFLPYEIDGLGVAFHAFLNPALLDHNFLPLLEVVAALPTRVDRDARVLTTVNITTDERYRHLRMGISLAKPKFEGPNLPRRIRMDFLRMGAIPRSELQLNFSWFFRGVKSPLIVDVGVECGEDYTLPGLQFFAARVFAFEPHPGNRACIKRRVLATEAQVSIPEIHFGVAPRAPSVQTAQSITDGHLVLFEAAASNYTGENVFFLNGDEDDVETRRDLGSSFVQLPWHSQRFNRTIPVLRVDDVVDEDIFLFKTDSEGHELQVLQGAEMLFHKHRVPYLAVEFQPAMMLAAGQNPVDLLDYINKLGYEIFHAGWDDFWPGDVDFEYYSQILERPRGGGIGGYWTELLCVRRVFHGQLI